MSRTRDFQSSELVLLVVVVILLHTVQIPEEIFATRPTFSRVTVSDPNVDWGMAGGPPNNGSLQHWNTSDGRSIYFNRGPIDISECKIKNVLNNESFFPFPHMSSVSYSSVNNTLYSTIWLTKPFEERLQKVNDSSTLQAHYRIVVLRIGNETLNEAIRHHISTLTSNNYTNLHLENNATFLFAGNQADKITYTYNGKKVVDGCTNCKEVDILTIKDHKLYMILYVGEVKKLPELQQVMQNMTNSTQIGADSNRSPKDGFKFFESAVSRVRIHYPSNWHEKGLEFISFSPSLQGLAGYKYTVAIYSSPPASEILNATEELSKKINAVKSFRGVVIEKSASFQNATFHGHDVYSVVYDHIDSHSGHMTRTMHIGIIYNTTVYHISYTAERLAYDKYLPTVEKMIKSLELEIPILTYDNESAGLRMHYPYNWANSGGGVPVGYSKNDLISSVIFYSPVKGPYTFHRSYTMSIDYDSPYGTGDFHPYKFIIEFDSQNKTWTNEIMEISADGMEEKILSNESSLAHVFEGQGYILMNLDLNSLNLPNQFYLTFSMNQEYLQDGIRCTLIDNTDFVSSPPPLYSIATSPTSLKDVRPGDVKDIQVQIKSTTTLPFQLSLSTNESKVPGLGLAFRPNTTSGIPNDLTTSDLHITVLPNATAQTYAIPIHADILLTPTFNSPKSASAIIAKDSNFTINVSPPLDIGQQISGAWNGFGPALNGFVGLTAAVIGVGGVLGGWFLRKSKREGNG